jgi:hypothetical protein
MDTTQPARPEERSRPAVGYVIYTAKKTDTTEVLPVFHIIVNPIRLIHFVMHGSGGAGKPPTGSVSRFFPHRLYVFTNAVPFKANP